MSTIQLLYNQQQKQRLSSTYTKTIETYLAELRSALRILYVLNDFSAYVSAMQSAIERNLSEAWIAGAATCGISESDISDSEVSELFGLILRDFSFIVGLGADVIGGRAAGASLESFFPRLNIWANRWDETKAIAQSMSCGDQKLKWVLGDADHCEDCLRLSGKVKRASAWAAAGIFPKMPTLACGGWNCKCTFVSTNEPLTAGRVAPSLSTLGVAGAAGAIIAGGLVATALIAADRIRRDLRLASGVNIGDTSINLETGHGLSFGQTITISEGLRSYTGTVFATAPNVVEVSPPVDNTFTINAIISLG